MLPGDQNESSAACRDFASVTATVAALDPAVWNAQPVGVVADYPILQIQAAVSPPAAATVLITAGVHGDEPAGVETVLQMWRESAFAPPAGYVVWPCLNPYGFVHDQRDNREGHDLNRVLLDPVGTEMEFIERALQSRRFDVCVDLHEDWEADGFYMYEGKADARWLGPRIVEKVSRIGAIDTETDDSDIPLSPGLLQVDPGWGGRGLASFLLERHADHVMIFETPTSWPLDQRVAAHRTAIDTVLGQYAT